jgi:predicted dehydrogenase
MNQNNDPASGKRRDFIKAAGAAGLTSNLFTGRLRGANNRITVGFVGIGMQGSGNLGNALAAKEQAQVVAVCDVYQPALERATAAVRTSYGSDPKAVTDFREILADKSIDVVCISTPDHWHAYMTVEACKAGKDVYVEKPACVYLDEGPKMVEAARKYKRVVQGGNMQRSMPSFVKAKELIDSGVLGDITWAKTWAGGLAPKEGRGNPADTEPPPGLDWDMWLGPAPKVPFNQNRWGVDGKRFPTFRYFWDYAGGEMTDWGIHYIDPVHQYLDEPLVESVTALGGRFWFEDNLETADTMSASFQYPNFMLTYELRQNCPVPMFDQRGGTAILGTDASVVVTRRGCWLNPVPPVTFPGAPPQTSSKKIEPVEFLVSRGGWGGAAAAKPGSGPQTARAASGSQRPFQLPNEPSAHWKNFFECVRTREKPVADIEYLVRSTASCLLANISMRAKVRCDLDPTTFTVRQEEARPFTKSHYRAPWKLEV